MSKDTYKNNISWFLDELASLDDDQIEGGQIEIEVADEEGNESFTSLSVRTIAGSASEEITRLRKAINTLLEESVHCTNFEELYSVVEDLGVDANE